MNWSKIWLDERGGWWRVLATVALCAAGMVLGILVYTLISVGGLRDAMKTQPSHIQECVAPLGTILISGLGLVGCLAGVRFVHRKPIARVFTDGRPFGIGLALKSAALWALLWIACAIATPGAWASICERASKFPLGWWPVLVLSAICAMTMGRMTEEVVFRGYLQTRVAAWVGRPWLAVCGIAIVFDLIHSGNAAAHTAIGLFGITWGAACIRAGTLAPMIGAHVMHDTLEIALRPSTDSKNDSTSWLDVVLIAMALAIWFAWLFWTTRTRPDEKNVSHKPQAATLS